MAGRFTGLTDKEWKFFEAELKKHPSLKGRGKPPRDFRSILNSIFYVLITGCRWCDLPEEDHFAPKSTAHRWLGKWESDGTFLRIKGLLLDLCNTKKLIKWDFSVVDGSFSPWEGWRRRN